MAGRSQRNRFGLVKHANTLETVAPERLTVHQDVVLLEAWLDGVQILGQIFLPSIVQVSSDAAGTDVVVVHSKASDLFEEPKQRLPFTPSVDDHRDRTEVETVGCHEQQM